MTEQLDKAVSTSNALSEQGVISSVEGAFAYVTIQKKSACGGCASSSSCGTSALASYFNSGGRNLVKVKNLQGGQVGDLVALTLDESQLLKHSFLAYGIPLLGLFILAIGFKMMGLHYFGWDELYQDLFSIVGGFLGVGLGWFFTHKTYQPVLPEMKLVSSADEQKSCQSVELDR